MKVRRFKILNTFSRLKQILKTKLLAFFKKENFKKKYVRF